MWEEGRDWGRRKRTSKALTREASSFKSAETTWAPRATRSLAVSLLVLRVIALTAYFPDLSAASTTDPPWEPVAPTMVRTGSDILSLLGESRCSL